MIHNVGNSDFFNRKSRPNYITHNVESGIFETSEGHFWKLRLQPGEILNPWTTADRPSQSTLCLAAFPNHAEKQTGKYNREIDV